MQGKKCYLSPEVMECKFVVEQGFANSLENPYENPEIEW